MTARKHLKQRIRARMEKTGESYATARRQIIRSSEPEQGAAPTNWHFPGNVPGFLAYQDRADTASYCILYTVVGRVSL